MLFKAWYWVWKRQSRIIIITRAPPDVPLVTSSFPLNPVFFSSSYQIHPGRQNEKKKKVKRWCYRRSRQNTRYGTQTEFQDVLPQTRPRLIQKRTWASGDTCRSLVSTAPSVRLPDIQTKADFKWEAPQCQRLPNSIMGGLVTLQEFTFRAFWRPISLTRHQNHQCYLVRLMRSWKSANLCTSRCPKVRKHGICVTSNVDPA